MPTVKLWLLDGLLLLLMDATRDWNFLATVVKLGTGGPCESSFARGCVS
jgi:hypothetical protein